MKTSSFLNLIVAIFAIKNINLCLAESKIHDSLHKGTIEHSNSNYKKTGHVLNIRDNIQFYEDPKTANGEKTVYITLDPKTVYVTVTETAKDISKAKKTTTDASSKHKSKVATTGLTIDGQTSSITSLINDFFSSVTVVKTETSVLTSLTTTTIKETKKILTSAPKDLMSEIGPFDMILGDRQKYVNLITSKTSVADNMNSATSSIKEIITPKPSIEFVVISSIPLPSTSTSTVASSIISLISNDNKQTTFDNATITYGRTSFCKSPLSTYLVAKNTTVQRNTTGSEDFLRNVRPYTGLPTSDDVFSNGGSKINGDFSLSNIMLSMIVVLAICSIPVVLM